MVNEVLTHSTGDCACLCKAHHFVPAFEPQASSFPQKVVTNSTHSCSVEDNAATKKKEDSEVVGCGDAKEKVKPQTNTNVTWTLANGVLQQPMSASNISLGVHPCASANTVPIHPTYSNACPLHLPCVGAVLNGCSTVPPVMPLNGTGCHNSIQHKNIHRLYTHDALVSNSLSNMTCTAHFPPRIQSPRNSSICSKHVHTLPACVHTPCHYQYAFASQPYSCSCCELQCSHSYHSGCTGHRPTWNECDCHTEPHIYPPMNPQPITAPYSWAYNGSSPQRMNQTGYPYNVTPRNTWGEYPVAHASYPSYSSFYAKHQQQPYYPMRSAVSARARQPSPMRVKYGKRRN